MNNNLKAFIVILIFVLIILFADKIIPETKPYFIYVYAQPEDSDYYYHVKAKVQKGVIEKIYLKNQEIKFEDKDYEHIEEKGEVMQSEDSNGVWWSLRYYGEKI